MLHWLLMQSSFFTSITIVMDKCSNIFQWKISKNNMKDKRIAYFANINIFLKYPKTLFGFVFETII